MGKTLVTRSVLKNHAHAHKRGGAFEVDGDKLDIDWNPTNYSPSTIPAEADSVDNLTAHLYGIDQALVSGGGLEVGIIIANPDSDIPGGYLECDGSAISRIVYSNLFSLIGTMYGVGDGSTTFNIPDYRGKFHRGWSHGSGKDPDAGSRTNRGDGTTGDNVGTKQANEIKSHRHGNSTQSAWANTASGVAPGSGSSGQTSNTGGNESRPRNVNVMWIIKY